MESQDKKILHCSHDEHLEMNIFPLSLYRDGSPIFIIDGLCRTYSVEVEKHIFRSVRVLVVLFANKVVENGRVMYMPRRLFLWSIKTQIPSIL